MRNVKILVRMSHVPLVQERHCKNLELQEEFLETVLGIPALWRGPAHYPFHCRLLCFNNLSALKIGFTPSGEIGFSSYTFRIYFSLSQLVMPHYIAHLI
jgi:hypothetical protein